MLILVTGNNEQARPWIQAFSKRPEIEIVEADPLEDIKGYKEKEVAERLREAIVANNPEAVCIASERKYRSVLAVQTLRNGCHALIVPPTSDTREERSALIFASEHSGKSVMVAYENAYRPGMLRACSLVYSGRLGNLLTANLIVHSKPDFKESIERITKDADAYHFMDEIFAGRLCVLNLLARSKGTGFSVDEEGTEYPAKIALNLGYGGTSARMVFFQSTGRNPHIIEEFKKEGVELPAESEFSEELRLVCDKGEIGLFLARDRELMLIRRGEEVKTVFFPRENENVTAVSHFLDFINKKITPFVDAHEAASAEESSSLLLDFLQDYHSKRMLKLTDSAEIPEFWRGLTTPHGKAARIGKIVTLEEYRRRMDWRFNGFKMLLMEPPRSSLDLARRKYFPGMALSVLAGVAGHHGCDVVTDDLNRIVLKAGILSAEEVEEIWGEHASGSSPDSVKMERAAAKVASAISLSGFDIIAFSFQEDSHVEFTLALCRRIKEITSAPIVFGGKIMCGADRLEGCVDYAVVGDGELALLCIIKRITEGWPLENIPGLLYPHSYDNLLINLLTDIRIRGVPAYNTELMEIYGRDGITIYPYMFVNGCPNRCSFCASLGFDRHGVLEIPEVLRQLREIHRATGAKHFYFLNHLLNIDRNFMNGFLDGLLDQDFRLQWSDSACLYGIDAAMAEKMRLAGCRKICWGLDTGSDRLLKIIRKTIRIKGIEEILRICRNAGIHNEVNFIIGLPHETRDDLEQAMRFAERNSKIISKVNYVSYFYAVGSPVYTEPSLHGLVKKGNTFDEVGGLKWAAKMEYNERAFEIADRFFKDFEKEHNMTEYDFFTE